VMGHTGKKLNMEILCRKRYNEKKVKLPYAAAWLKGTGEIYEISCIFAPKRNTWLCCAFFRMCDGTV
ncbi:MAG: hypothetical protein K2P23_03705, partial [Lachnospiraceae bacterium]|nr:hypothetical protein [Lachnospiraceae bacterium]